MASAYLGTTSTIVEAPVRPKPGLMNRLTELREDAENDLRADAAWLVLRANEVFSDLQALAEDSAALGAVLYAARELCITAEIMKHEVSMLLGAFNEAVEMQST